MTSDYYVYIHYVYRFYNRNLKAAIEGYRQDQFPNHYQPMTVIFSCTHQWLYDRIISH